MPSTSLFTAVVFLLAPGRAFTPAASNEAASGRAEFMPCNLAETIQFNFSWTQLMVHIDLRGVTATSTDATLALFGGQFYNLCLQDQTQSRTLSRCIREVESVVLRDLKRLCSTRENTIFGDVAEVAYFAVAKRVSDEYLPYHDGFENEKRWLQRLADTGVIAAPLAYDDTRRTIVTAYAGAPLDTTNAPVNLASQLEHILSVLTAHNCRHNDIIPRNLLVLDGVVRLIDFSWACELDQPNAAARHSQGPDLGKSALALRSISISSSRSSMFDDRCAVENVIEQMAPARRPDAAETHLIIDWTEHYTDDFLETACQRVGLELTRAVAMPSIMPDATRLATTSTFHDVNIDAFDLDPRGAAPFKVFVLRDINPTYVLRTTTTCSQVFGGLIHSSLQLDQNCRVVNAKVFDLRQNLRNVFKGVKQLLIHGTGNIQETKDNLSALGLLEHYVPKQFGTVLSALRALDAVPGFRYVMLRHAEERFDVGSFTTNPGIAVNLLVNDYFKAKTALDGSSAGEPGERYDDGGHGVRNFVLIAGRRIPFDLHTIGDGYFDSWWQGDVLRERVLDPSLSVYIPSERHLVPLLLHHIITQKRTQADVPKEDAVGWLHQLYTLDFTTFDDAQAALDAFMVKHGYHDAQAQVPPIPSLDSKELVDGLFLPCDFSGAVQIQVSWKIFFIPVEGLSSFGTSYSELDAVLLGFSHNLCNSHTTEHLLDAQTCANEIKDAALAAIASQCAVAGPSESSCGLVGGVTNQEVQDENCVELAVSSSPMSSSILKGSQSDDGADVRDAGVRQNVGEVEFGRMLRASCDFRSQSQNEVPTLSVTPQELCVGGYHRFVVQRATGKITLHSKPGKFSLLHTLFATYVRKRHARTLVDIGCSGGLSSFLAIQAGFKHALCLDHDLEYIELVTTVARLLAVDQRVAAHKFSFGDTIGQFSQPAFPADVVLCGAIIHWVYSLTADFGSFDLIFDYLMPFVKPNGLLMIEWIDEQDGAIAGTIGNARDTAVPYTTENFERALIEHGAVIYRGVLDAEWPHRVLYVLQRQCR
jgi:hypothetical protein